MYPYLRLVRSHLAARFGRRLALGDDSLLRMIVWPGDLDFYPEMNNGRHLTLMDLGRMDFAQRAGLVGLARRRGWMFVVGGASVRYRRRLPPWRRYVLRTRVLGHDERWFYFHQTTERGGEVCSGALVRAGLRTARGLVPAMEVLEGMGHPDWNPPLPDWARDWAAADDLRPEAVKSKGGAS